MNVQEKQCHIYIIVPWRNLGDDLDAILVHRLDICKLETADQSSGFQLGKKKEN